MLLHPSLLLKLWTKHFISLNNSNIIEFLSSSIREKYTLFRRRQWHPTPGLLPGKSHGRRSLVGCRRLEEPGRLQSLGSLRVGHDWATSLSLFTFRCHALEKEMATHSSALAWRIPGMGEPGGLPSMGLHRVWHCWRDLAAAVQHLEFSVAEWSGPQTPL